MQGFAWPYPFERGATIGKGGTSRIYRCQDTIGIRGVCKVMPKAMVTRQKVQQEIMCLRDLAFSPKVVNLFDAMESQDEYVMIMEWCRGGAVNDYTSNYELYSENTVASILRGVLRGLAHVHRAGIIHRDIKPGNVLFTDLGEDAEVKIADFGSAVRFFTPHGTVEATDLVGTPWYMAPETLRSQLSTKSDIWSAGVMAYQLLTGFMPFDDRINRGSPSIQEIWNNILLHDPKWVGKRWEPISNEAKDFCQWCLSRELSARPTAEEALTHPWLTMTNCSDRFGGMPLQLKRFRYENSSLMHANTWNINKHKEIFHIDPNKAE